MASPELPLPGPGKSEIWLMRCQREPGAPALAGGGTQASRPQVRAVAVAGGEEKICFFRNGNDFPLDPPGSFQPGAGPPQALGSGLLELLSGLGGQLLQAGSLGARTRAAGPPAGLRAP